MKIQAKQPKVISDLSSGWEGRSKAYEAKKAVGSRPQQCATEGCSRPHWHYMNHTPCTPQRVRARKKGKGPWKTPT